MDRILLIWIASVVLCQHAECTCRVDDVQIQTDFDIHQFTGRWYEQKWRTTIPQEQQMHDYQHTFYLHPDSRTITVFVNGRMSNSACRYYTNEMKVSDIPGKLLYKSFGSEEFKDYWVVSTDYTSYFVTYGCKAPDADRTCPTDKTDASVWSRTPKLPGDKQTIADAFLDGLCVNKSELVLTPQTNDCRVDRDCAIYSISKKMQPDFDIEKYMGVWYRQRWVPYSSHPQSWFYNDFQHNYVLHQDGKTATVFIEARNKIKNSADIGDCLYFTASLRATTIPGKFEFRRKVNATATITSDYWVISTDYTSYAVVYGCRQLSETGHCEAVDSWVWTRTQTLPADKQALVESLKDDMCVNSTAYVATQQTNDCERTNNCSVSSIEQRIQPDFDITKYMGTWYEQGWLAPDNIPASDVYMDYQQTFRLDTDQTVVAVAERGRLPADLSGCFHETRQLVTTATPGMLLSRANETDPNTRPYWVMSTDYVSYAAVFSCLGTDAAGDCRKPMSWVWSRTPRLADATWPVVIEALDSMCVNYDNYHKSQHNDDCDAGNPNAATRYEATAVPVLTAATVVCLYMYWRR